MTTSSYPILVNGEETQLELKGNEPTVSLLIAQLDLTDRRVAVEVNGAIVPRAEHEGHRLCVGDRVEIVTFVGGG